MSDAAFLDTNILVYAFGSDDPRKEIAEELIIQGGMVSVQTLNEFTSVARQKARASWPQILYCLRIVEKLCPPPRPLTADAHRVGLTIAQATGYHIYDSMMLATAIEASCKIFYSEDLHHDQTIEGLTIRNPFKRLR